MMKDIFWMMDSIVMFTATAKLKKIAKLVATRPQEGPPPIFAVPPPSPVPPEKVFCFVFLQLADQLHKPIKRNSTRRKALL